MRGKDSSDLSLGILSPGDDFEKVIELSDQGLLCRWYEGNLHDRLLSIPAASLPDQSVSDMSIHHKIVAEQVSLDAPVQLGEGG